MLSLPPACAVAESQGLQAKETGQQTKQLLDVGERGEPTGLENGGADAARGGRFLVRLSENGHLGSRYAPENFEHMAEKLSLRYVEIRGLF